MPAQPPKRRGKATPWAEMTGIQKVSTAVLVTCLLALAVMATTVLCIAMARFIAEVIWL